ncbi:MAG: helix-turn-helix domain-containing protein, partial [Oscillospiraceae bacterium]|nr:helix-turn-helix domain-containing protein [Oscillospiraceae bacterium]
FLLPNAAFKMMPQTQQKSEEAVACQQTLSDTWEKDPRLLQFTRGVDGWALLLMGDSTEALCTLVASVRQNIEQIMRSSGNLAWFGGLGRPVNRLNQLMKSYQEANKAFACRFLTDSRKILSSDEIGSLFGKSKKMDLHAIQTGETNRHAIDRFLRSGTLQEVEGFVEQYFCSIGEVNYQSLLFQNYIVMDCYLAVCDFLGALELSNDSLSEQVRDVNLVLQGPMQIEQIKLYIKTLFSETMTLRNEKSERKYSRLMENAKTYLDENYENNDLSLNVVAAQVNVSPSYFSSIFRQKTGVTFVEYLTRLRMEKAKELLLCSDCSSTEIGYTVGYKDPHYFSSLFKKMYGCTPKEYRMHRGEAK